MKIQQVIFSQPGSAELRERDFPELRPHSILIESEVSLVSAGTERALLNNAPEYPLQPGYSLVGRVAALGPGVQQFEVGERVAASTSHGSHVVCDAGLAFKIPDEVPSENAAFFTVGAMALYAVRRANLSIGDPVMVIGQGLIGLIASQICRYAGALPVVGVDIDPDRLAKARSLGVDLAINGRDHAALADVLQRLPGGGVAATIELSGAPETIDRAIASTRRRGRVVAASLGLDGHKIDVYGPAWQKGLSIVGAYFNARPWRLLTDEMGPPSNWPLRLMDGDEFEGNDVDTSAGDSATFLRLLAGERVKVAPLVTDRATPQDTPRLFERLARSDFLGALIQWQ